MGGLREARTVKTKGPDPLARIEETQNALRENIKASERLLEKTQALIRQHRREVEERAD